MDMLNKKRSKKYYIIMLIVVIVATTLISYLLEKGTKGVIDRQIEVMQSETETESGQEESLTKPDKETELTAGIPETESTKQEQTANEQNNTYDTRLQEYCEGFDTRIEGKEKDISDFLQDKQEQFKQTVAEYIFSAYGKSDVEFVTIKEFVSAGDEELAYQITVNMGDLELPFISTYNKKHDFFSLYSPTGTKVQE